MKKAATTKTTPYIKSSKYRKQEQDELNDSIAKPSQSGHGASLKCSPAAAAVSSSQQTHDDTYKETGKE